MAAPAAVVALSLEGDRPRVLALGRHLGADPVSQARRPGSTVKPLVAWVAAEAGVLRAGDTVTCRGAHSGSERFRCFGEHGELGVARAITTSCNVFFFDLGSRLGLRRIGEGLSRLGLARATGLVSGEASGFIATEAWAAEWTGPKKRWELPVAAGHGPLEVTLLQLAAAYAELAKRLSRPSADVPEAIRQALRDGLRQVVSDEAGTGHGAYVAGLEVWGKTGTAEAESFEEQQTAKTERPENGWFVGFAPGNAPTLLVAAVVLGQGTGGKTAAPLVGRIFGRVAALKR